MIYKLKSNDDQIFEVNKKVAFSSGFIRNAIQNMSDPHQIIYVPMANGVIMAKIIVFCTHIINNRPPDF